VVLYRRADHHHDVWTCVSPINYLKVYKAHARLAITARVWSDGMSLVIHLREVLNVRPVRPWRSTAR